MLQQPLTTVSLPEIYCRSCHLSTRSDLTRCLHCNKPLIEPPRLVRKAPRVMPKPVAKKVVAQTKLRRRAR